MQLLEQHIKAIENLCKLYSVKSLYVFGSILTPQFSKKSDIDFVVEFEPIEPSDYADNYYDFKFALEELLKRNVDLLELKALRNQSFKAILEKTKVPVYGTGNQNLVGKY
jgi:hypothetical protein